MSPVKSPELHRLARRQLGPVLAGLGFGPIPRTSTASWVRAHGHRWVVIWVQPYRSTAPVSGTRFTIELRLSTKPETGGDGPRRRLPMLLTDEERRTVRRSLTDEPDDPWFLAATDAGLAELMAFCGSVLPGAVDRFLERSPGTEQPDR